MVLGVLLALLLAAGTGCDGASPTDTPDPAALGGATDRGTPESAPAPDPSDGEAPLLEEAPWFELPEDWSTQHPLLSPNAQPEIHWSLMAAREVEPSEGDGDGTATLVRVEPIGGALGEAAGASRSEPFRLPVGSTHRFTIEFVVGAHGIAPEGRLFLLADPFWSWSPAQTADPRLPGYTTAEPGTTAAELIPSGDDASFEVGGRGLAPGERITLVYGAGASGARVDRYVERRSEILIGVDAEGDGLRAWLEEGVFVETVAPRGGRLVAHGPAERAPGEPVELTVAWTDALGNRAPWPRDTRAPDGRSVARFRVRPHPESTLGIASEGPFESRVDPTHPHRLVLRPTPGEGTLRLLVEGLGPLEGVRSEPPPIVLRASPTRLVWGDLHGHSRLSDGTGEPEDYYRYAREVARLDVVALTDHDHWGLRPLDARPETLVRSLAEAQAAHAPGRFVVLPGYEWTSWLHGHRHVLYFGEDPSPETAPILSALDPATDRPDELWAALRGRPALTFAHHSAGDPIATNWLFAPDPELEPLTEIASVHGMSEASDAPVPVAGALSGHFVRDVLMFGARLGFVGSGDTHDGHPGLGELASGQAGLAGIFTRRLDRPALLEAMRSRRTFATNGIRPWLSVSIDGVEMGGTLVAGDGDDEHLLRVRYEATAPIAHVDLVRSGRIARLEPGDALGYTLERRIPALSPGDFHYVRIVQRDGGTAWSSPIFVDPPMAGQAPAVGEAPPAAEEPPAVGEAPVATSQGSEGTR